MTFFLTLLMTFLFVLVAILVFVRIGTPFYQLQKHNVEALLRLVASGEASDNDWQVFLGVPIRHNERLEDIRLQCCDIHEREYIGGSGRLLTDKGMQEVRQLLQQLEGEET